ncbi:glycoside hydrolase family 15 protein [Nocardioides sp.]|uniref:glycoside hydrolase family 15 protein n=1 Tax=Nocardioides sp. TaxID=35761 RepID=UPI003783C90D
MLLRLVTGVAALAVAATGALVSVPSSGEVAPGPRGARSTWTEADKDGFGTARTRASNVWFTLQQGRVSEVFYPDLSTPSVRSLELAVTGDDFADRSSTDMRTRVQRPDDRSLRYTQVSEDEDGRYRVVEHVVTDPRHDTLVVRARLVPLDGGHYRLWALYDPALTNHGMDDRATSRPHALVSTDRTVSSALVARPALRSTTSGLVGTPTDPWPDLGHRHRHAGPGNVVQAARLADDTTLALGFGGSVGRAVQQARGSLGRGFAATSSAYDRGWHGYVDSLKDVPASAASVQPEYLASALVLAAAEDKQHPGAFVASPSAPWVWGDEVKDLSSPSGAYHLVWSRDAYQFGTALWAMGDRAAARRIVRWLFGTQQLADGSFPQNSDVSGTPVWGSLQLDEVAFPIVLAHLVGKRDAATWHGVRKAARFLVSFRDEETGRRSPYSPQERWENQSGYSPATIAAEVAGLVCAADLAKHHGRPALARHWLRVADRWQRHVEDWTVTTNGPLDDAPYFLRLTKNGRPDTASPYEMGDGGPRSIDQRKVVDPSFLDLVRLGLLPADDPAVVNTLDVVDRRLRVDTPNGPSWHRFSHDGYGETADGGEWTITDPGTHTTFGRGWPILTGERGEYAVTAGADAASYLATMAAATGEAGMLAEQVWDGRPPTGDACCPAGEGTRSATPLVWSHAQLVRLAWTIQRGRPVDQQPVVADRYLR